MTIKNNTKNIKNIFIFKFFLILSVIAFVAKQSQKILVNNKNDKWPNIYTLDPGKITKKKRIKTKDNFYYYYADKGDHLCMYSSSPCISSVLDKNIKHIKKFTYSILIIN